MANSTTTDTNIRMNSEFPFEISTGKPNKETVSAMLEAERIAKDSSVKGYNNADDLFVDLDK